MQRIPQVWPGWQADELIGQGAYGKVYRASRTVGGHTSTAAIKVIEIPRDETEVASLRSMGMDALSIRSYFEETAQSVIREIAVMDALKGAPNVVGIEDYQLLERGDGVGWTILIRMELLEDLASYQARVGLPGAYEAARIGVDLCRALQFCHDAGVIHRDVKPENVFVSRFGEYKLGDFGLSRRLDEGSRSTKSQAGSGPYMAPEVLGGHYDKTVDVYSLGVMLYRWLNGGRPPFIGATETPTHSALDAAQLRRLSGERPSLPSGAGVPQALAAAVRKAVEPVPADRWQSAAAFGAALQDWLDGKPVDVGVDPPASRTSGGYVPAGATTSGYNPLDALGATAAAAEAREREERARAEAAAKAEAERRRAEEAAKAEAERRVREEATRKAGAEAAAREAAAKAVADAARQRAQATETAGEASPEDGGTIAAVVAWGLGIALVGSAAMDQYLEGWNDGIFLAIFALLITVAFAYVLCGTTGAIVEATLTGKDGSRTIGVVSMLVGVALAAYLVYGDYSRAVDFGIERTIFSYISAGILGFTIGTAGPYLILGLLGGKSAKK